MRTADKLGGRGYNCTIVLVAAENVTTRAAYAVYYGKNTYLHVLLDMVCIQPPNSVFTGRRITYVVERWEKK